jgi:hypothetical protein
MSARPTRRSAVGVANRRLTAALLVPEPKGNCQAVEQCANWITGSPGV